MVASIFVYNLHLLIILASSPSIGVGFERYSSHQLWPGNIISDFGCGHGGQLYKTIGWPTITTDASRGTIYNFEKKKSLSFVGASCNLLYGLINRRVQLMLIFSIPCQFCSPLGLSSPLLCFSITRPIFCSHLLFLVNLPHLFLALFLLGLLSPLLGFSMLLN